VSAAVRASESEPGAFGLDRRRFIAAALAFSAGALTRRGVIADADVGGGGSASGLLDSLSAPAAAARIGRAYLAEQPREASPDLLVNELGQALVAAMGSVPSTPEAMLTALTSVVEAEYCSRPLVRADGWLLAPTEARLYALAALAGAADRAPESPTPLT
jgi:hypothetical protein